MIFPGVRYQFWQKHWPTTLRVHEVALLTQLNSVTEIWKDLSEKAFEESPTLRQN